MKEYKSLLLTPNEVLDQWFIIEPFVKGFLQRGNGESTTSDIGRKCINGEYHTWIVFHTEDPSEAIGVMVTKIDQFSGGNKLHIIGLAGHDWSKWSYLHEDIEFFARQQGCNSITQWGRRGWRKALEGFKGTYDEEYKEVHVVMEMKLENKSQLGV